MKIIVAGSRGFNDYSLMKERLDLYLSKLEDPVIVSGGARGADSLAVIYAVEHNLKYEVYPANWEKYGKIAGYERNAQMAMIGDALVAFWDGKSKGTKHMIDLMKDKPTRIVRYNK